ncbi:amino acid ABC transporter ATP-binding protein [Acetobacter sp. TBRC 12305]|uniref:Amino acid ABC transporter ATP-binding protein n=1 Tax=Acetobacter garciniae TaxID=2817435 RepID=A0A939HL13_9PROT|nr:amino acid ABC transporter ATP-binding protein [Acetobacter garciniae]MBO1324690.1 amino acid ABC transporter ATP-binding protein [Acetobacter garciniae]MBX0344380.1 amino acid ABC transporter ATP-binding protein [Acetobacter garciniae]
MKAEHIAKRFGDVEVLRGVSLQVGRGDLVSIIGPSGCGKSTFLRCLNCLEIPDHGSITAMGVRIERAGGRWTRADDHAAHRLRSHVGMVFQSFNLFAHLSVLDNIVLAPRVVKGEPAQIAREQAMILLEKVGLADVARRYPATLSGGQQQRAAIARALAMRPEIMLYDEPTSALDPIVAEEVLAVMRTLDEEGMTQIVVTHDMRFAQQASDTVIYMDGGQIIESGPPDMLCVNPTDERTRRFLRTVL